MRPILQSTAALLGFLVVLIAILLFASRDRELSRQAFDRKIDQDRKVVVLPVSTSTERRPENFTVANLPSDELPASSTTYHYSVRIRVKDDWNLGLPRAIVYGAQTLGDLVELGKTGNAGELQVSLASLHPEIVLDLTISSSSLFARVSLLPGDTSVTLRVREFRNGIALHSTQGSPNMTRWQFTRNDVSLLTNQAEAIVGRQAPECQGIVLVGSLFSTIQEREVLSALGKTSADWTGLGPSSWKMPGIQEGMLGPEKESNAIGGRLAALKSAATYHSNIQSNPRAAGSDSVSITGRLGMEGSGLDGVTLIAVGSAASDVWQLSTVNAGGIFAFNGIPPGECTVMAGPFLDYEVCRFDGVGGSSYIRDFIPIQEPRVECLLVDNSMQPLSGWRVERASTTSTWDYKRAFITDQNGRFLACIEDIDESKFSVFSPTSALPVPIFLDSFDSSADCMVYRVDTQDVPDGTVQFRVAIPATSGSTVCRVWNVGGNIGVEVLPTDRIDDVADSLYGSVDLFQLPPLLQGVYLLEVMADGMRPIVISEFPVSIVPRDLGLLCPDAD